MADEIVPINKTAILKFATDGSKLAIKKNAEKELLKLLAMKDFIDELIEKVKEDIINSGKKVIGESFKGVVGEQIKAVFRMYGDKFEMEGEVDPQFVRETIIKRVNAQAVDEYLEKTGALPEGIKEKERTGKLIITKNE